MKLLFVINPVAGKGKTKDAIPTIEAYCNSKKLSYDIRETKGPGDAVTIARSAEAEGFSAVIALGGDGTVLEVANGLIGSSLTLGIIPLGTGNDFARAVKIPIGFDNILEALKIITETEPIKVDVGKFSDRFFMNVSSIGFDAEIIRDLANVKKYIKGKSAYIISVFLKFLTYKPIKVKLLIDGEEVNTKVFLAAICNGVCYGGGMLVNPNGSISDGYLDLILIRPLPRYQIPYLLVKFFKGLHLKFSYVTTYRCKEVQIVSEDKLAVNIDGEYKSTSEINFKVQPLSINIFGIL